MNIDAIELLKQHIESSILELSAKIGLEDSHSFLVNVINRHEFESLKKQSDSDSNDAYELLISGQPAAVSSATTRFGTLIHLRHLQELSADELKKYFSVYDDPELEDWFRLNKDLMK